MGTAHTANIEAPHQWVRRMAGSVSRLYGLRFATCELLARDALLAHADRADARVQLHRVAARRAGVDPIV